MRVTNKKTIAVLSCLVLFAFLPGCTNWKGKYEAKVVEFENLKGQLDYERAEKGEIAQKYTASQQMVDELRKQIEQQRKSPAEASGFGEGYDVAFNAAAGTITVTLSNEILFDSGKAELKKATSTELDHIYEVLKQKYPNKDIDVVGHTDTDPIKKSNWKDNWELSAQRALSVTRYLIQHGISDKKIQAVACGQARPIVSNATAGGKAKNRRVEIVVHIR
ncbi:MAG: OmpA family protein [Sedimentisphaerales bacterium]|nr:OmpA family protein [Sedimentisphaerales bacterium]